MIQGLSQNTQIVFFPPTRMARVGQFVAENVVGSLEKQRDPRQLPAGRYSV